ncbi:protein kinase [Streptomyces sp. NPDC056975]|uniref:protein kinase domain-containing protein n=1 Tax=Streptomyces sp. NPDC056975 TaxID=3345985 RepID=UPI003643E264
MADISKGTVIGGRYALVECIAVGGMGEVWLAHDTNLNVDVAVKRLVILSPQATPEERRTALAYARQEVRHAVALRSHPNIVTVHDLVEYDGTQWMVMDWVKGRSLAAVLKQGTLRVEDVAAVARGVLAALRAAHEAGIIHRDVKPGNIMIDNRGHVWLADFGIAKHHSDPQLTSTGTVVGTAEYMAPERFDETVLPAGDLWSLGVTLYEAVEGVSPFRRDELLATINAVNTFQPSAPHNAGRLTSLLTDLLNKDPDRRPTIAQAEAMLDQQHYPKTTTLTAVLPHAEADTLAHTPPADREIPPKRWSRIRAPRFVTALGLLCLVASAITVVVLLKHSDGSGRVSGTASRAPVHTTASPPASTTSPGSGVPGRSGTYAVIDTPPYCTIKSNSTGGYLGAVDGGGLQSDALQLGAAVPSTWERFTLVRAPSRDYTRAHYAIQTANRHYLTAVVGGGLSSDAIHADATTASGWEEFSLVATGGQDLYAIRAPDNQHYLTGVKAGGSLPGEPVSSDSTTIGPGEIWRIDCGLTKDVS